jgi:hypothetical protein
MTVTRPPVLTPERKPAWRAACVAYREKRRAGYRDLEAHNAAVKALQMVRLLPDKEAGLEATQAISYTSKHHSEWFWRGVGSGRGN